MKKKNTQLTVKDNKYIKNILIQVDLKKNSTIIHSSFSPWENIALIIEGLAVTAEQCMVEGIDRNKVYKAINEHIVKALPSYRVIKKRVD